MAWGLCYNKEMSPSQIYCDDYFKLTYPCSPGASYHGRGAIPVYWYVLFFLPFLIVTCHGLSHIFGMTRERVRVKKKVNASIPTI